MIMSDDTKDMIKSIIAFVISVMGLILLKYLLKK